MGDDTLPVILCGKRADIAQTVVDSLKPENEVIHVIVSTEQAIRELPVILVEGSPPKRSDNEPEAPKLGSQRFDRPPVAIIVSCVFDDAEFRSIRDACGTLEKAAWVRQDLAALAREGGPAFMAPGYHEVVTQRLKAALAAAGDGKMGSDYVHIY